MRKIFLLSAMMLMFLAAGASAQKQRFLGTFINEDPNTRGITRVTLGKDGTVRVWGSCHPTDCDWGKETAAPHAADVSADLDRTAQAISAVYVQGFAFQILIIKPLDGDRLEVESFTRFTDNSGRSNYTARYVMAREGYAAVRRPKR